MNKNNKNNINQMRVSRTLSFFAQDLLEKYNLKSYRDKNKPAFFYGIYTKTDLKVVQHHKSMKVIIWSGSDINYQENDRIVEWIKILKKLKNIYFISNSKFISDDMTNLKLSFKFLPISGIRLNKFSPIVKGNSIYIYTSATKPTTYGKNIYEEIIKKLPQFNFILAANTTSIETAKNRNIKIDKRIISLNKNDMKKIYQQCFIGLRLTEHDGISYTVAELGLCGIRCIHNGNQPNAINYTNIDDIIKSILLESRKINTKNEKLAHRMKKYLTVKKNWRNGKFYLD